MANLPAFCDNCGTAFNSGIAGSGSSMIAISNCKAGPCPVCGSMGTIPDGTFNLQERLVTVLAGPASTHERFMRLKAVLEQAKAANKSAEETIKSVEAVDPTIGALARFVTPASLFGFLTFLFTLIQTIATITSPTPLSKEDLRLIIQETISAMSANQPPQEEDDKNGGDRPDGVKERQNHHQDPGKEPDNKPGFIST